MGALERMRQAGQSEQKGAATEAGALSRMRAAGAAQSISKQKPTAGKSKIPTPKVNTRTSSKGSIMSQVTAGASKVTGQEIRTTLTDDDRLTNLKGELAKREASGDMGGTTLLKKEIDRLNTQKKYSSATYGNTWADQAKAKYAQTDLSQEESKAWDDYLNAPTASNRKKAEQISAVAKQFQERNMEALKAGTDKSAKDLTVGDLMQSFVGYLPQLEDQIGASIKGGLVGAGAGSAIPVVGTAMGAKAGITAANAAHSYSLMRGSAFKELLDLGVDEEVAKKAASDEAVISALIEMGDTIMDVSGIGLGVGSLISVAEKGMAKAFAKKGAEQAAETAAKKLLKAVGKYGVNVAQEAAEEGSQQAVSIANRNRTLAGKTGGAAELMGQSIKTLGKALTGEDMDARGEILQAASEGAKIAAMMGVGGTILQQGTAYAAGKAAGASESKGKAKTKTPEEVARQAAQMPKSEAVESMNSETRQAVEKAQNASYNETVKTENVTVLNQGATLYTQLGMKQKKAEAKAAVVQKVVEGKAISVEELKALNLTDPKARGVFTQLTGYVFPENTKVLEDRATQMAHMKRVPEVMAENARVLQQTAAAQANIVAEDAMVGQEAVSPEQVSTDIAETEDGVQAVQKVAEARDPGDGPASFEHYAQAYREQVNPNASEAEVRAEYTEYMADQRVVTLPNGVSLNRSGLKGLIYQNTGKVPDDQTLTAMMDQLVREQENRQRPGVKQNNVTESAAQSKSAEDVDGDLRSTLSDSTRKVIEDAERKLGVKIFIDRKVAGPKGKKVRGSNNSKLREIHIAVDAGGDLSHGDVILQVLRHELTHYLQSTSPKAYEDFKAFVVENMDDYQSRYDKKAKAYKGVISEEDKAGIEDELVAEYAEKLFTDEEFIDMIARTDRSLAEKILDAIRDVVKRLTGEELSEARETALKAQKLWEKALENTAVQVKNDGLVVNKKGDPVALHHDEGMTQFSLRTYDEQGRAYLTEWLKKAVKKKKITQAEADDILLQMEDIYELCQQFREDYAPFGAWSDAKIVVDEDGKPVFSVVKSNGDYSMNLDFSLVCKKRRTLDAVFNELVRTGAINDFNIGQEEIVKINDIIRTYGFETACAMCFVDARRFRQGDVADTFATMYNDLVKSMIPEGSGLKAGHFNFGGNESLTDVANGIDTVGDGQLDFATLRKTMEENGEATVPHKIAKHLLENPGDRKLVDRGDFMSTAGFNAVKKQNPALLSLYNSKKGSGGPKAAFGDVQYLSDILKRTGWTPAKAFAVGGVRVQSFSDYMPRMVFDYAQMIGDLAAKKLPAQAYTKEELFVKQFGLTGMKINMSLIPKIVDGGIAPGLDADGNYVWADESFDYDTAMEIQNAEGYSKNCGTICVGVSDEHIRTLMSDDNIRMVIPYHKSGLNPVVAKMNHIEEFDDYTNFQNTRHASTGEKLNKGVAGDKKLLKEEPRFNELMRKLKDPRAAAEQYVRWCEDNDLLPKFDQFAYRQIDGEYVINNDGKRVVDENYYKLLEDFSVYDNGEYAPQTAVKAVFPKEGDAFGSMKDLIQRGLAEDAVAEGKRDAEVPRIVQEIRETLGAEDGTDYSFEDAFPRMGRGSFASEVARIFGGSYNTNKKYWTPKFTQAEWDLWNSSVKYEAKTSDRYVVDDSTKWLFADKNGVQVFGLYSTNDLENPTLLYASSGAKAEQEHRDLRKFMEGERNASIRKRKRTALDRVFDAIESWEGRTDADLHSVGNRGAEMGDVPVSKVQPGRNRGADSAEMQDDSGRGDVSDTDYSFEDDAEYMAAVERGDMETAQKMVDEAAKATGYPTKLYHGTQKFGFTKVDVSKSDDKISFFATTDPGVARTYSGMTGTRRVSQEYDNDETDAFIEKALERVRDSADALINAISREFPYALDYSYTVDYLEEYADQVAGGRISMEDADNEIYEFFTDAVVNHWEPLESEGYMDFAEWQDVSEEWEAIATKINEAISSISAYASVYRNAETSGNYALYGNTDNFFEVECKGALWRKIKVPEIPLTKTWTTRTLAEYAKFMGYKGVRFKDIVDEGDKGAKTGKPADVYVFFDPQSQIKSADPVTYDDNGNVIPLSKRFNTEDPDIRYSFSNDQSGFVKMFDEMYGEGAAEQLFKSAEQMQRAAERTKAREKAAAESIQAAKSLAETEAKDKAARWLREHKNDILKRQREKYQEKVGQLRKEKTEAVRTAVANTKAAEREKAEKALTGQEINLKKHAAKRLRVKDNLYAAEKQENRERTKLRRNAAKRVLSDSKAVAKKRAEIETANGMVDTIRKNPRERTDVEKRQAAAEALRTLGRTAYRNFVNQAHDIDRFAKRQRDGVLASTLVNILGGANSTTEAIYKTGLVDKAGNRIGDSMKDTFLVWNGRKVDEAKQALLQDYMLHVHNIDRMSFVAKAREALESFEAEQPWLAEMDGKEFAKLVALTDKETEKLGKQEARDLARQYAELLNDFREAQDKPIFADSNGEAVTADTSREIAARYEAENPWLKEKAESIYSWWDAFMKAWAVGDSISQEEYDRMRRVYPHYVPTYRKDSKGPGGANHVGSGVATVGKATQKAKGSTREVENIEDSFANIASKIIRLARTNELYMNIVDTATLDDEGLFADMAVFDWDWQSGAYDNALQQGAWLNGETNTEIEQAVNAGLELTKDGYKLTGWHDGRKYSAFISKELYESIANTTGAVANDFEKGMLKIGNMLTGPMKKAITGVNPFFAVRNVARDVPSAIINSTSGVKFPKYMAQASAEMAKNSANWQAYQALGGTSAGYYNNEKGFIREMSERKGLKDTALDALGTVNNVTEAVTRFAEYLATIDRLGDTYEARLQGIKNAAEVTVDFSRKGRYGKVINAWVPYWNPAVQGIDKTIRSVADAPDGSTILKQALRTGGRAAMCTVLLEGILYTVLKKTDRDDEWEELSDRDKDTYYCIPLKDSHTFLKIPKNREWGAILGTPFMRILQGIDGRENPFENYIETSLEPNFLPGAILRPREGGGFTSDIIGVSQALDLAFNEDFAGRTIVPYALEQGSLTQQYDDDTSAFSKKLGELINFSPMQIDYILSDYFGDFGDIFVKATAESTWSGDSTPQDFVASAWDTFTGSFFADNRYSNQTNSDYYEMLDNLSRVVQDKKNQLGNEAYKKTTEYKTQKAIEELYGKQITDLNKDARELPDGPDKDAVKSEITSLTRQALDFYEKSMAGEINEPLLTATYAEQPSVVSNELIRLNSFAEDYSFEPTDYKPSKYTDPKDKKREYVLDDEAKDQYRAIYDRLYGEIMAETMNKSKYRKANDRDKVAMLEEARDEVTDATKEEFLEWLAKNRRSTAKR